MEEKRKVKVKDRIFHLPSHFGSAHSRLSDIFADTVHREVQSTMTSNRGLVRSHILYKVD